jgi:hypothetical protein
MNEPGKPAEARREAQGIGKLRVPLVVRRQPTRNEQQLTKVLEREG